MSESDTLKCRLAEAVDGLLYPSESDEPFEVVELPLAKGQSVRQAVDQLVGKQQPIVEQPVNEFFAGLEGSDDEARYAELRTLLATSLADLAVYRVGEVRVDVYLVGRKNSRLLGVKTRSIET